MRLLISILSTLFVGTSLSASPVAGIADVYSPESVFKAADFFKKSPADSNTISVYTNYLTPELQADLFDRFRISLANQEGMELNALNTQREFVIRRSELSQLHKKMNFAIRNNLMFTVKVNDSGVPLLASDFYFPLARLKASSLRLEKATQGIDVISVKENLVIANVCQGCSLNESLRTLEQNKLLLEQAGNGDVILDLSIAPNDKKSPFTKKEFLVKAPAERLLDPRTLYTQLKMGEEQGSQYIAAMLLNSGIRDVHGEAVVGQEMISFTQIPGQETSLEASYTIREDEKSRMIPELGNYAFTQYATMSAFETRLQTMIDKAIKKNKQLAFTDVSDPRYTLSLLRVSDKSIDPNAIYEFDSTDESSVRFAQLYYLEKQVVKMDLDELESQYYVELQGLNSKEEKIAVLAEIMLANGGELPSQTDQLKKNILRSYLNRIGESYEEQKSSDQVEVENPEFAEELDQVDAMPVESSDDSSMDIPEAI